MPWRGGMTPSSTSTTPTARACSAPAVGAPSSRPWAAYDNALVVGSLSKAFSCAGGFIGCTGEFKRLLKIRSSTYIFGGPVPPPYLEAICTVLDILDSEEYPPLRDRLDRNIRRLTEGLARFGLAILGGLAPIVSLLVGDEEETLEAGRLLFERGYYVQSVAFPAVPYHAGVLRIQVNANHSPEAIDGLLAALVGLRELISPRGGPWGAASPDFSP